MRFPKRRLTQTCSPSFSLSTSVSPSAYSDIFSEGSEINHRLEVTLPAADRPARKGWLRHPQWDGCSVWDQPHSWPNFDYGGAVDTVTLILNAKMRWNIFWSSSNSKIKPVNLREINPKYSLEGLMLKMKLQYFHHLMWTADSLEKSMMLGKTEGRGAERIRGWDGWMASLM